MPKPEQSELFSPAPLPIAALSDAERLACLRLIRSENVGPVTFRELINHFGGAQNALDALPELSRRGGFGRPVRVCPAPDAERELENARRCGAISLFTIEPGYPAMQREVAERAGRVNGALGGLDWVPIRYINRAVGQDVLAGLYRLARVGLVTPLRDGMNLVAKEFVAAQSPEDPGVLVLSRFAGAARELDGAILVNPYDIEAVGNAIAQALSMPLEDRRKRYERMMKRLLENDIFRWCSDFMRLLRG